MLAMVAFYSDCAIMNSDGYSATVAHSSGSSMLMTPRGQRIFKRRQGSWIDPGDGAGTEPDQAASAIAAALDDVTLSDLQLEVALYIESICAELRLMARTADLEALSYFLEMARIEASIQIERRALTMPE